MSSSVFSLDVQSKRLTALQRRRMADLGLNEPYDLEAWLSSANDGLFGRRVLWLARQDRASDEQRSDLIGVDQLGNLLVTELKRGELAEDGVTQALAYAAEYGSMSPDDLAALFIAHSKKEGPTGLVARASSIDDARSQLSAHVGADTEVNESQILLLVGEDFSAKALAICDYLNGASGDAGFSIECWRYGVYQSTQGTLYFILEQILPPPSVRQAIDEKREASKAKKYARDPARMAFVRELVLHLDNRKVTATRRSGQIYECRLKNDDWACEHELWFSVHTGRPRLILPDDLGYDAARLPAGLHQVQHADGRRALEFGEVAVQGMKFDMAFGDQLIQVVELLQLIEHGAAAAAQPAAPAAPPPEGVV